MQRRICSHCGLNVVDESKQTMLYRDYRGNKWDSCIRPICDICIETGNMLDEDGKGRLILSSSRFEDNMRVEEEVIPFTGELIEGGNEVYFSNFKIVDTVEGITSLSEEGVIKSAIWVDRVTDDLKDCFSEKEYIDETFAFSNTTDTSDRLELTIHLYDRTYYIIKAFTDAERVKYGHNYDIIVKDCNNNYFAIELGKKVLEDIFN